MNKFVMLSFSTVLFMSTDVLSSSVMFNKNTKEMRLENDTTKIEHDKDDEQHSSQIKSFENSKQNVIQELNNQNSALAKDANSKPNNDTSKNPWEMDINLKYAHERKGEKHVIPEPNRNMLFFAPFVRFGDVFFEGSAYYGKQFRFDGQLQRNNTDKYISYEKLFQFEKQSSDKNYRTHDLNGLDQYKNGIYNGAVADDFNLSKNIKSFKGRIAKYNDDGKFYRSFTRIGYKNPIKGGPNVLIGDIISSQLGSANINAGLGIQIKNLWSHKSIGAATPIIISSPSKIECYVNDVLVGVMNVTPGIYRLDDLQPELRLSGARIVIKDVVDNSIEYFVDCYEMKKPMKKDKLVYEFSVYKRLYFDLDNPREINYDDNIIVSGFFKYGLKEHMTIESGAQFYKNGGMSSIGVSYSTPIGEFGNRLEFSYDVDAKEKLAAGLEIDYLSPVAVNGCYFNFIYSFKGSGFTTLGATKNNGERFNNYLLKNKYYGLHDGYAAATEIGDSYTHALSALLSLGKIGEQDFSLSFYGKWTKTMNYRCVCTGLTGKIHKNLSYGVSGGLVFDGPNGGSNGKYPDYRFTLSFSLKMDEEFAFSADQKYDDNSLNNYAYRMTYTPKFLKGLEMEVENSHNPGLTGLDFSVKYNSDYVNCKVSHTTNFEEGKNNDYTNRIYLGTNVYTGGIRKLQKSHIMRFRQA